jgi:SNF2 family DNA or RNA helicase
MCVTGTPFNNEILDIISLCQFINIAPYNQVSWWKLNDPVSRAYWRQNFLMTHEKPSWIPKMTVIDELVEFDKEHAQFYEKLQKMASNHYVAFCQSPNHLRKRMFNGLLVWLLRLRQASLHPLLMMHTYEKRTKSSSQLSLKNEPIKMRRIEEFENNVDTRIPEEKECDFLREANPFDIPRICSLWNHGFTMTTKLTKLIELVQRILKEDPANKIVIFSQWTGALDIIEHMFETEIKYRFIRLDGSIGNSEDRNELVKKFREDRSIRIFMSTTSAGGVGINLESAQTVILFDACFNPFLEAQACDRVHRVTQKRPVTVYRLRVQNSVENDIFRIQLNKKQKAQEYLYGILSAQNDGSQDFALNSLSKEEVSSIFKKRDVNVTVISTNKKRNNNNGNSIVFKNERNKESHVNPLQFMQNLGLVQKNQCANVIKRLKMSSI